MKAYTDLNQSKKLAEILPLESADMIYYWFSNSELNDEWYELHLGTNKVNDKDLPCWSLAALLNIIELTALFKTSQGWVYKTYIGQKVIDLNNYYNEPIDACYEMILKLHELKLL